MKKILTQYFWIAIFFLLIKIRLHMYSIKKFILKILALPINGEPSLLVHCLYQMLPLNHKRTTSSLAPLHLLLKGKLVFASKCDALGHT